MHSDNVYVVHNVKNSDYSVSHKFHLRVVLTFRRHYAQEGSLLITGLPEFHAFDNSSRDYYLSIYRFSGNPSIKPQCCPYLSE